MQNPIALEFAFGRSSEWRKCISTCQGEGFFHSRRHRSCVCASLCGNKNTTRSPHPLPSSGDWHHAMENKSSSGSRPHLMRVMLIQNVAVDQRFANGAFPKQASWASLPPKVWPFLRTETSSAHNGSSTPFILLSLRTHIPSSHSFSYHVTASHPARITGKIIALAPGRNNESTQGPASLLSRSLGKILQGKFIKESGNDAGHGFHGFGCKTRKSQHPRRTNPATTLYGSSLRSNRTLISRLKGRLDRSGPMPRPPSAQP